MRLLAIAVVAAFVVGAVSAASAEPPKKRVVRAVEPLGPGSTYVMHRDEQGRVRTKILVQKRSYLDGGTEVMPGDVPDHYTNFVDMHQRPTSIISNDNVVPLYPIPDPFFLPGKNNPYFR